MDVTLSVLSTQVLLRTIQNFCTTLSSALHILMSKHSKNALRCAQFNHTFHVHLTHTDHIIYRPCSVHMIAVLLKRHSAVFHKTLQACPCA